MTGPRVQPAATVGDAGAGAFDAFDVGQLWTPFRTDARVRRDCLPFHAEHTDLLRSSESVNDLLWRYRMSSDDVVRLALGMLRPTSAGS